jgi:hypothetical protein
MRNMHNSGLGYRPPDIHQYYDTLNFIQHKILTGGKFGKYHIIGGSLKTDYKKRTISVKVCKRPITGGMMRSRKEGEFNPDTGNWSGLSALEEDEIEMTQLELDTLRDVAGILYDDTIREEVKDDMIEKIIEGRKENREASQDEIFLNAFGFTRAEYWKHLQDEAEEEEERDERYKVYKEELKNLSPAPYYPPQAKYKPFEPTSKRANEYKLRKHSEKHIGLQNEKEETYKRNSKLKNITISEPNAKFASVNNPITTKPSVKNEYSLDDEDIFIDAGYEIGTSNGLEMIVYDEKSEQIKFEQELKSSGEYEKYEDLDLIDKINPNFKNPFSYGILLGAAMQLNNKEDYDEVKANAISNTPYKGKLSDIDQTHLGNVLEDFVTIDATYIMSEFTSATNQKFFNTKDTRSVNTSYTDDIKKKLKTTDLLKYMVVDFISSPELSPSDTPSDILTKQKDKVIVELKSRYISFKTYSKNYADSVGEDEPVPVGIDFQATKLLGNQDFKIMWNFTDIENGKIRNIQHKGKDILTYDNYDYHWQLECSDGYYVYFPLSDPVIVRMLTSGEPVTDCPYYSGGMFYIPPPLWNKVEPQTLVQVFNEVIDTNINNKKFVKRFLDKKEK